MSTSVDCIAEITGSPGRIWNLGRQDGDGRGVEGLEITVKKKRLCGIHSDCAAVNKRKFLVLYLRCFHRVAAISGWLGWDKGRAPGIVAANTISEGLWARFFTLPRVLSESRVEKGPFSAVSDR